MARRLREVVVLVLAAATLTSLALGQVAVGLLLLLVATFLGARLARHGRIIGVDQRAADRPGPPTVGKWARRTLLRR